MLMDPRFLIYYHLLGADKTKIFIIMKKIIVFLTMLFCLNSIVFAQAKSCRVTGDADATIVLTVDEIGENYVLIAINSDSSKYVNVTFNVQASTTEMNGHAYSQPYTVTVAPRQSTSKKVYFKLIGTTKLVRVERINLESARCK